MATDDIEIIKRELKNCLEVELPYNFKTTDVIKYITLNEDSEKFYIGGKFVKMGNERIVLSNGGKDWSFKTKVRDDNNNVIYKSRIFIEKNDDDNMVGGNNKGNTKELNDIIISQQKVIDKMTIMIKNYKLENDKYKLYIQKLKHMN